jgi:hypothetical protein
MRRMSGQTVNPVEKIEKLRRVMEHTRHDHAGDYVKNIKDAQLQSDFAEYEIQLQNLRAQVARTIAEQHDKEKLRQVKRKKEKTTADINYERKNIPKNKAVHVKQVSRTSNPIMKQY